MSIDSKYIALLVLRFLSPDHILAQAPAEPAPPVRFDPYEVTNRQMAAFLDEVGNIPIRGMRLVAVGSAQALIVADADGFSAKEGFADHPAVEVTFAGARAYCEWAGKRLPTEREWQRACEGDAGRQYPWGDAPDLSPKAPLANLKGDADGFARTAPVGRFPAGRTPEGLWDLGGNAWEWTAGPEGQPILRGGSWSNSALFARCSVRDDPNDSHTFFKGSAVGFRCVGARP